MLCTIRMSSACDADIAGEGEIGERQAIIKCKGWAMPSLDLAYHRGLLVYAECVSLEEERCGE